MFTAFAIQFILFLCEVASRFSKSGGWPLKDVRAKIFHSIEFFKIFIAVR